MRIAVMGGELVAECIDRQKSVGTWIEIRRNDVNPITGRCGVYVGCSECGAPLPTDSMLDFIDESDCKFCYNCGTKMEVLIN